MLVKTVFDLPPPILAPTLTKDIFYPVGRIICIGRNYAAHAREMGRDPNREAPFFFTKWAQTLAADRATIAYPPETSNFHFEAELVIAIGRKGRRIAEAVALEHVYGYATGLDMTRRDIQLAARDQGRPWDAGKNVEQSSPLGVIHPVSEIGHLSSGFIRLTVNGETKQNADLRELIWSIPEIISYVSKFYRLEPGDLIYSGTPAGVGPVKPGDQLVVSIEGLSDLRITIGEPSAD
jgi:fumarylpyruvate hydrolase